MLFLNSPVCQGVDLATRPAGGCRKVLNRRDRERGVLSQLIIFSSEVFLHLVHNLLAFEQKTASALNSQVFLYF